MNDLGGHHENCGFYPEYETKPRAGFKEKNHT